MFENFPDGSQVEQEAAASIIVGKRVEIDPDTGRFPAVGSR